MALIEVTSNKELVTARRSYVASSSFYNSASQSASNSGSATFSGISSGGTNTWSNSGSGANYASGSATINRNGNSETFWTSNNGYGNFAAGGTTTGQYTYVASQQGTKRTISISQYTNVTTTSGGNIDTYSNQDTFSASLPQTQLEVVYNPAPALAKTTGSVTIVTGTTVGTIPVSQQRGIEICSTGSVTTTQTQTGATTSRTTTTSKFSRSFTTPTEQEFPAPDASATGNNTFIGYSQPPWDAGIGVTKTVALFNVKRSTVVKAEPYEYILAVKPSPPLGWQPMSVCYDTAAATTINRANRVTSEYAAPIPCRPTSFTDPQPTASKSARYGISTYQYTRYWDGLRSSSVYQYTNLNTISFTYFTPLLRNETVSNVDREIITRTNKIPSYVSDVFVGYVSTTAVTTKYGSVHTYLRPVGSPRWQVCQVVVNNSGSGQTSTDYDSQTVNTESGGAGGSTAEYGRTNYIAGFDASVAFDVFGARAGMTLHEQVYPDGYVGFGYIDKPTNFYAGYSFDGFEGEDFSGHAFLSAVKRIGKFNRSNNSSSYEGIQGGAVAGGKLIVTDTKNYCIWPAPTSVRTAKPVIKSDVIGFATGGFDTSTEVAFTSATYETKTELGGGTVTSKKVTWSFNATYKVTNEIPDTSNFRSIHSPATVLNGTHAESLAFTGLNGYGFLEYGTFGGANANIVTDGTMAFDAGEYSVKRYSGTSLIREGSTVYTDYQTRLFPQGERWIVSYRPLVYVINQGGGSYDGKYQVKRIDTPAPVIPY